MGSSITSWVDRVNSQLDSSQSSTAKAGGSSHKLQERKCQLDRRKKIIFPVRKIRQDNGLPREVLGSTAWRCSELDWPRPSATRSNSGMSRDQTSGGPSQPKLFCGSMIQKQYVLRSSGICGSLFQKPLLVQSGVAPTRETVYACTGSFSGS